MYVSQIMWDTILCNMTECQVCSQNCHLFIFFVEPKWLNKMKGNVEWAKESSLKVTGKTLWASILCTSRCSSLSSFSIRVMSSRQKGHNILLTLFKCFIFCLTLELTKQIMSYYTFEERVKLSPIWSRNPVVWRSLGWEEEPSWQGRLFETAPVKLVVIIIIVIIIVVVIIIIITSIFIKKIVILIETGPEALCASMSCESACAPSFENCQSSLCSRDTNPSKNYKESIHFLSLLVNGWK